MKTVWRMSCLYPLYPTVFSLCTTHRNAGMRNMSAMTHATGSPKHTPIHARAGTSQMLTPQRAIISITPLSIERLL